MTTATAPQEHAAPIGVRTSGDPAPFASFEVGPGELTVVLGPTGSGKSRVLRSALGLATCPGVAIRIAGIDLGALPHRDRRSALRDRSLVYLPQEPILISNLTSMENLLLPVEYDRRRDRTTLIEEAQVGLELAGLGWAGDLQPAALTRDDQRVLALLRGLLRRPGVALLDDPFGGMDRSRADDVRTLITSALGRHGCAVLATGRRAEPFGDLGTRIVRLRSGPVSRGDEGEA